MKTNNLSKIITQVKSLNQSGKSHEQRLDRLEKVLGQTIVLMHEGFSISLPGNKSYTKKDPTKSSVGPSENRPLKVGDSSADILAKMFNFSVKVQHQDKKQKQLEHNLDMERLEEDERRHKGLLKSISNAATAKRITRKSKDGEEDKSFSLIDIVVGGVKGFVGVISAGLDFIISHIGMILPLAAAAHMIADNWEEIKKFMDETNKRFEPIKEFIDGNTKPLQEMLVGVYDNVSKMITDAFSKVFNAVGGMSSEAWEKFRSDPMGNIQKLLGFLVDPLAGTEVGLKKQLYGEEYIKKIEGIIKAAPDVVQNRAFGFGASTKSMESKVADVLKNPELIQELKSPIDVKDRDIYGRIKDVGGVDFEERNRIQRSMADQMVPELKRYLETLNVGLKVKEVNPQGVPIITDTKTNTDYVMEKDNDTLMNLIEVRQGMTVLRSYAQQGIDTYNQKMGEFKKSYEEGKANPAAGPGQPTMEQTVSSAGGKISSFMDNAVDSLKSIPTLQESEEGYQQGVNLIKLPGQAVSAPSKQKNDAPSGTILCRNPNETYFGITLDNTCPF